MGRLFIIDKFSLHLPILLLTPAWVGATDFGHGNVNVGGSIVDTPCAIDTESQDQTVLMPTMTVGSILGQNKKNKKDFFIKLINCDTVSVSKPEHQWGYYSITFYGDNTSQTYPSRLFDVKGEAKGVGLAIRTVAGEQATPGASFDYHMIAKGENILAYSMYLESNGQKIKRGTYSAVIRFAMNYY